MNNVTQYRVKAKLTQRALAAKIGVSRPLLQRIEASAVTVRYEKALELAVALHTPLKKLFPDILPPQKLAERLQGDEDASSSETIDYSGSSHSVEFTFAGGLVKVYQVDAATAARVRQCQFNMSSKMFVCFTTDRLEVAVNTSQVIYTRFMCNPGIFSEFSDSDRHHKPLCSIKFHFSGNITEQIFKVEPDTLVFDHDPPSYLSIQLQALLFNVDLLDREEPRALTFLDEDGEEVLVHFIHVQVLEIPIENVHPKALEAIYAGIAEDKTDSDDRQSAAIGEDESGDTSISR